MTNDSKEQTKENLKKLDKKKLTEKLTEVFQLPLIQAKPRIISAEDIVLYESEPHKFTFGIKNKTPQQILGKFPYDRLKLIDYGSHVGWDMDRPEPRPYTENDWKRAMYSF